MWDITCLKYIMWTFASMVVEPTSLVRVNSATFDPPDADMQKLVRRARGTHALFHIGSRDGVEVVLRGTGDAARLVVPASCR